MSSKAKLPEDDVRAKATRLARLAEELADGLEELEDDERWKIWNLGGAAFGRHRVDARGPGVFTAKQLAERSDQLAEALQKIEESFKHRLAKEAERRERRRG